MWLSKVAYTTFLSKRDGSIELTQVWAGIPDAATPFDTFFQVLPPSRVTCRFPSSVPTQIVFASSGLSVMVKMVQWFSADVLSALRPPLSSCFCFALLL